jgi:Uma2 family endonuclease
MEKLSEPQADFGPYTWRDFIELDEDDPRELLDGYLVEIEVPSLKHERIVHRLTFILEQWALPRGAGEVLGSGFKVRINDRRAWMPDAQFYRAGNSPEGQEQGLERGHPDLVVEVISPSSSSKDRVQKRHDYAAIGVPEYWLIDPEARILERQVLREGAYLMVEPIGGDVIFRPESFEGLEIDLRLLWNAGAVGASPSGSSQSS